MSSPSTTFRMFYPDTNTVNSAAFFAPDGSALTPQTIADGTGDPSGFKSKVITFAEASEPLLVTPVFATPASPVSLYLCRDDAGTFTKVLDETVFNPVAPGRPTPPAEANAPLPNGTPELAAATPVAPAVVSASRKNSDGPNKVLVLGLDGATFDLVKPWAAAGYLPTLKRLMDEGAHGSLRSTTPPMTGPAWTPDGKTLFLSVQHPGELTEAVDAPTSRWPGNGDKPRPATVAITGF